MANNLYRVAGIDNRSPVAERPFGYVVLLLGGSVAGRVGFGASRENPGQLTIWHTRETPSDIGPMVVGRVRRALADAFPQLVEEG